jgi:hypothetical protein
MIINFYDKRGCGFVEGSDTKTTIKEAAKIKPC